MSFVNWLRGVKAKVDIEPIEDGNVILQDNGDGTADLFVDQGNQRLHVTDSTQTSGGHTIWNAIKTALTQRTKLWFADAKVTDDSTEQATKVEVVQLIDDESELTNAPDGVYQGDYDDAPEDVLDASMVAYNNGSVEDALDELVKLTIKTETQSVTASAVGTFTITKPTGAKAYWVVETDKYASCYFVRYREHVYGIFGYASPHDPYQGALTVTVQYI